MLKLKPRKKRETMRVYTFKEYPSEMLDAKKIIKEYKSTLSDFVRVAIKALVHKQHETRTTSRKSNRRSN